MAIASSGQILPGVTIGSGGLLSVLGGGVAVSAVILAAGSEYISAGGADSAATLVSGGMQFVGGGAAATGTRIEGFFSSEVVLSGGTVSATQNLGGQLIVSAGGIEYGASLSGATEVVFGSASGTIVSNSDQILSGGVAFGAMVVGSLGLQLVSAGTAYAATIGSGAIQTIYSGALASLTTVSGGQEVVAGGAGAVSTTLEAGGSAVVSSGGSAVATVASGGTLSVVSGGSAYATVLSLGGVLRVRGGATSGTVIGSGGLEQVAPSGGGSDSGAIIASGGRQTVGSGGIAFAAVVQSGGVQQLVSEDPFGGGATSQTVVQAGGVERVLANGTAFATTLSGGGAEVVSSGGIASGTVVRSGGIELVLSGGGTFGATVDPGGALIVLPGGTAEFGVFQSGAAMQGPTLVLDAPGAVSAWASAASGVAVGSGAALYVLSGGSAVSARVAGGGQMLVASGGTAYAASIGAFGTLELQADAVAGGGIVFAGPAAALALGGTAMPTAALSGFVSGDSIDLRDIAPGNAASATLDSASDVLTVSAGGGTYALALAGDLGGARFQVIGDGASGSLVTEVACYAAGTRVATDRGDLPVEALVPGDYVYTQSGRVAPVRWVGRRLVECRRHRWPERVMPIRVAAHAFAPGQPRRDLLLSPDHAVFTGGVLIPVRYLVNGTTVAPVAVARVTYVHVELDRHDVILAEGLPCESFLDTGNRAAFANGGGPIELHPDFARRIWQAEGCAELALAGPRLVEARRRLLARAALLGHRITRDPALAVLTREGRLAGTVRAASWCVSVPKDTASLVLRSRVWTPEQTDPAGDDPRRLGVALSRLMLDGREVALDSPALTLGWHMPERGLRWTDGAGAIPVAGVREIAFELAMTGRYWQPAFAGTTPGTMVAAAGRAATPASARR